MRRALVAVALVLLWAAGLIAACSVGELDLASKGCPCANGLVCDTATNTCQGSLPSDATGPPPEDAGSTDAAPLLTITGLTATWSTPNMVRWDWMLTGDAAHFRAYQLTTGPTASAIETGIGVDVFTSTQLPELASFDSRDGATMGPVAMWTLTAVKNPGTNQFLRVTVTDDLGRAVQSDVVMATSAVATSSSLSIFDGHDEADGSTTNFGFDNGVGISPYYVATWACGDAGSPCNRRADLVQLGLQLGSTFDFTTAYLQVAIGGNGFATAPAQKSLAGLVIGPHLVCDKSPGECRYFLSGFTAPSGPNVRTVIQMPLRVLRNPAGDVLTLEELQNNESSIDMLSFEGTWMANATVYLFEASLHW